MSISQPCFVAPVSYFFSLAGKIFLRNKSTLFCLIQSIKACNQVFLENKYGNAWFRRLQKSTEQTFLLKHFYKVLY